MRLAILTFALATTSACTWVHMGPGADKVRVIGAGGVPANCVQRGEVTVSVRDRIALYDRNPLRVREELETLARNEAPGLAADTIQPVGEPRDGEQAFRAFRCR